MGRGWTWIAEHAWLYPALEAVHIAGIALLVGSLMLLELRIWGWGAAVPVRPLARLALPVTLGGFAIVAASGLLMFASQPAELLAHRLFLWKLGLVGLAGVNAVLFHARGGLSKLDVLARAQTALSVGLWLAVIICGRWLAY
ncbi:hypothetical protein V4F39_12890 [Aquincola sp. MAHUQ-54]|uniref:Copper resistance protein D n=1 Tax=Aquincola agrisoli TaxID=3119538 RepID=A0AAW9QDB8_9BURK